LKQSLFFFPAFMHRCASLSTHEPAQGSQTRQLHFQIFHRQQAASSLMNLNSRGHFIECTNPACVMFTQSANPILLLFTMSHFNGITRVAVYQLHHLHPHPVANNRLHHRIVLSRSHLTRWLNRTLSVVKTRRKTLHIPAYQSR
jgi:hypothetical protein